MPKVRKVKKTSNRVLTGTRRRQHLNRMIPAMTMYGAFLAKRMISTALPSIGPLIYPIFDMIFDYVASSISTASGNKTLISGAFGMFTVKPATFMKNSPLLASTEGGLSFPGHPVSVKRIEIRFTNTSNRSERAGRWAAVIVPYREPHDSKHYVSKIKDLTFDEICSMPKSVSRRADQPIILTYVMSDKTAYCARPRELTEDIAVVLVVWDQPGRARPESGYTNTEFNCEIELKASILSHPIFGPTHRTVFTNSTFELTTFTKGLTRIHHPNGSITREPYRCSADESDDVDTSFVQLHLK